MNEKPDGGMNPKQRTITMREVVSVFLPPIVLIATLFIQREVWPVRLKGEVNAATVTARLDSIQESVNKIERRMDNYEFRFVPKTEATLWFDRVKTTEDRIDRLSEKIARGRSG